VLEVLKKCSGVITAPEYCLHINLKQYLRKAAMPISNFLQKKNTNKTSTTINAN
jgi:hypothetical protein